MPFQLMRASRRRKGTVLSNESLAPVTVSVAHRHRLRDEPARSYLPGGCEQVRGANIVQRVSGIHILMTQRRLLECSQHMNNCVGLHSLDCSEEVVAIHHVCQNRL